MKKLIHILTILGISVLVLFSTYPILSSITNVVRGTYTAQDTQLLIAMTSLLLVILAIFLQLQKLNKQDAQNEKHNLEFVPLKIFMQRRNFSIAPNQHNLQSIILEWIQNIDSDRNCSTILCKVEVEENWICSELYIFAKEPLKQIQGKKGVIIEIEAEQSRLSGVSKNKIQKQAGLDANYIYHIVWD